MLGCQGTIARQKKLLKGLGSSVPESSESTHMRSDYGLEIARAAAATPDILQRVEPSPQSPTGEGHHSCNYSSAAAWAAKQTRSCSTNVAIATGVASAAATAGGEGDTGCSLWIEDNRAMSEEETMRRWLSSRSMSSTSCSPKNDKCRAAAAFDLLGCSCGGDNNKLKQGVDNEWPNQRGMSQPKYTSSGTSRPDHTIGGMSQINGCGRVECNVVAEDTERTFPEFDAPAAGALKVEGGRTDHETRSSFRALTSVKNTAVAAVRPQAPGGCCRSTSGATSYSHKPRRDSFGASLQAAIKMSPLSIPRPLFQTHREESDGGPPIAAAAAAAKGPPLEPPWGQQRGRVMANRPEISPTARPGTSGQVAGRSLQGTPSKGSNGAEKVVQAVTGTERSHHREVSVGLEFDQKPPCPDWMNDEEWQQVGREENVESQSENPSVCQVIICQVALEYREYRSPLLFRYVYFKHCSSAQGGTVLSCILIIQTAGRCSVHSRTSSILCHRWNSCVCVCVTLYSYYFTYVSGRLAAYAGFIVENRARGGLSRWHSGVIEFTDLFGQTMALARSSTNIPS